MVGVPTSISKFADVDMVPLMEEEFRPSPAREGVRQLHVSHDRAHIGDTIVIHTVCSVELNKCVMAKQF